MKVEQIMNRSVETVRPDDSLNRAAQLMWECACGGLAVVDGDSRPVGFLTDRDICMAAYTQGKPLAELPVSIAMARKVIVCKLEDDLEEAIKLMRENRVRRLPVVDHEGKLAGLLSLDDLARQAARPLRHKSNRRIRDVLAEVLAAVSHEKP